jgi:hypothetical protein
MRFSVRAADAHVAGARGLLVVLYRRQRAARAQQHGHAGDGGAPQEFGEGWHRHFLRGLGDKG